MDKQIFVNPPFQFEEEEKFVSTVSELDATLAELSSENEKSAETNAEQSQAIAENAELDAQQAEAIQSLQEQINAIEVPSLAGYASQEWVEGQGYLTEHQDLSEYAKSADVPSVEGLASQEWVEGQGYLTEHQDLSEYAKSADVPSVEGLIAENDVKKLISQLSTRIEMIEKIQTNLVVANSAEEIANIEEPLATNIILKEQKAIESLTSNTTYKSIAIVGGDTEKTINISATDSIVVDGLTINGEKDGGNGKINFTANTIEIKNVEVTHGSSSYNVFEGSQKPNDESTHLHALNVNNLNVDDVELKHNVINIYTPANNAQIKITDSYFNLNVSNSNVLRISNYANATNVVVTLENIEWTYENVDSPEGDFGYAGVVLYQPAGNDVLLSGDTSAISTWTFNFKNCKYNGEKITSLNFGQHSQIMYMYNVGGSKKSSNPLDIEGLTINFE